MGDFECDACDKTIAKDEACWYFKNDAPIHCSVIAFCLCKGCHEKYYKKYTDYTSDYFNNKSIRLDNGNNIEYEYSAMKIFKCNAHDSSSENNRDKICKCKCVVCNGMGLELYGNREMSNDEKTWSVCKVRIFHADFTFFLCPNCQPECHDVEPGGDSCVWYSGEILMEKWFFQHLKFNVINDTDFQ